MGYEIDSAQSVEKAAFTQPNDDSQQISLTPDFNLLNFESNSSSAARYIPGLELVQDRPGMNFQNVQLPAHEAGFNRLEGFIYSSSGTIRMRNFIDFKTRLNDFLQTGMEGFKNNFSAYENRFADPSFNHRFNTAVEGMRKANTDLQSAFDKIPDDKLPTALMLFQNYMSTDDSAGKARILSAIKNLAGSTLADAIAGYGNKSDEHLPVLHEAERLSRTLRDSAQSLGRMSEAYLRALENAMKAPDITDENMNQFAEEWNRLTQELRKTTNGLSVLSERPSRADLIFRYNFSNRRTTVDL